MTSLPQSDSDLGQLYFYGLGCRKNFSRAFEHLNRAARAGDRHCQNLLGYMFDLGLGTSSSSRSVRENLSPCFTSIAGC